MICRKCFGDSEHRCGDDARILKLETALRNLIHLRDLKMRMYSLDNDNWKEDTQEYHRIKEETWNSARKILPE